MRLATIDDRNDNDLYLSQNQLHNKLHCLRSMIRTTLPQPTGSLRLGLVHSPQVGRGALIINGLTGVPVGAFNCRYPQRPKFCEETTRTFIQ